MKKLGTYDINLTGTRATVQRVVYSEGDKFFVKWYGEFIEVAVGRFGYRTVEAY